MRSKIIHSVVLILLVSAMERRRREREGEREREREGGRERGRERAREGERWREGESETETESATSNCIYFIETLHDKMIEIFEVSNDEETRLWQRYMTNSYELLTNQSQTVSDAGIYGGQVLILY